MATVGSRATSPVTSHARIRIRIGDLRTLSGPDRLDDVLARARDGYGTEVAARVEEEIAAIRLADLGSACSELIAIGQALASAGHRAEPLGPPATLMLFHVAGLTCLDPRATGLLGDVWPPLPLDTGDPAPWLLQRLPQRHIGLAVSMHPADLVAFARIRGYSLRVDRYSYEKVDCRDLCFDQITAMQFPAAPGHETLTAFVSPDPLLRLAAAVTPEAAAACLHDAQTFHLLATGDTAPLGPLRSAGIRRELRRRKPASLEALAAILAAANLEAIDADSLDGPAYLEDVAAHTRAVLGIAQYEGVVLCRSLRYDSFASRYEAWVLDRAVSRGMESASARALWDKLRGLSKRNALPSKDTVFPLAFRCLRAAYLQAHEPENFRAIIAADARERFDTPF